MKFIVFNIALDANGFHCMLFDLCEHGALFRIALDADRRFFGLHLLGVDLIPLNCK